MHRGRPPPTTTSVMQNQHFTRYKTHHQQTWAAFKRLSATWDQSRRQSDRRSQTRCGSLLLGALCWDYPDVNVKQREVERSIKRRLITPGSLTWLFCFSSESSWPSGRLRLRVGWMQTTLLSQEGGPTGGSLSSWLSENSSSSSSVGG